ncbi:MAG: BREX-1 system adenine-specific DNA-methyltransferase PglX [Planctomycetota bacterium]|nr:BREX-1 system adenine-specific DNA-methyltransferase PglX [Planctomycetota bacterium]
MEFYIEPAEQTPEVQEQLKAITPSSLNPEELTFLDPACGSAHILVEAYDLFKAIYLERGYRDKDIPALILQRNLIGLEIDDRAAQLAGFALFMKARADDRRIFDSEAKPNILAFEDSQGMKASEIHFALTSPLKGEKEGELESSAPDGHLFESDDNLFTRVEAAKAAASRTPTTVNFSHADIASLLELFENAKTFGSLIQVPPKLAAKLPEIEKRLDDVLKFGDLTHASAHVLNPLLRQARFLARQYDAVVANPPYMGTKYYTPKLKEFVNREYKEAKADLYACFIERNKHASKPTGFQGMINIPNWMFLSSFEELRMSLFETQTIDTFVHNGRGVFGSDFGSCAFVIRKAHLPEYRGSYRRLFEKQGSVASNEELEARFHTVKTYTPSNADFARIPGSPVAYWVSHAIRDAFRNGTPLADLAEPRLGMTTGDNNRFLRSWWEVTTSKIGWHFDDRQQARESGKKWFPYNKGGEYRKWYGNNQHVVNWQNDGFEIIASGCAFPRAKEFYFRPGLTWTFVSSSSFGVRRSDAGFVFDVGGSTAFPSVTDIPFVLGFLCSTVASKLVQAVNPSLNYQAGDLAVLPVLCAGDNHFKSQVVAGADAVTHLSRLDWDSFEISWDFATLPLLHHKAATVRESQEAANAECLARFARTKDLEEANNRLFIEAYGLQDELSPEVPDDQITLYRPDRTEDIKRLISYAIGCMMGRYSLDKPGLVYAHAGNRDFDQIYFSPPNQPPQPAQTAPPNSAPVPFPCPSVPSVAPFPSDPPQRDLPPDSSHGNARKDTEKVTTQTSAARTQVQPNPSPFPCPSVSSVAPFPSDPSERNLAPDGSHGNARKDTENVETPTPAASTQFQPNSSPFPCPSVSSVAPFLPDQDGIIPLLETDWGFRDDAASRFEEFIGVAWPTTGDTEGHGKVLLEENLKFVADSLGPTGGEQPRETIRRYLATGFYKHHLSMYKRRPIYWLFSSGKQRAFQCLVYLHRYHDGTLARMRTQFVIPLQGQIAARIEQLEGDKAKATSTSHRKKLQKEQDDLKKQQAELLTFEEKLKHYADMRISLDLDDGVKVNYGKFGDLLAEVKAVTGGKDEE